jgi:predicted acetyltransferase
MQNVSRWIDTSEMNTVELLEAKGENLQRIENMMQFYMYDFSEWIPLSFNDQGWFSIRSKAEYWAKPSTRPFLITVNDEVAGFVTVDDEVTHPEANFSIGYFFVGRKFRGSGVGAAAVKKLLGLFSGCWQIFHINQNASASAFWKKVIPEATLNTFSVHSESIDGYDCTLYKFRQE